VVGSGTVLGQRPAGHHPLERIASGRPQTGHAGEAAERSVWATGLHLVHDASLLHGVDYRSMFCVDACFTIIQTPTKELTKDAALITISCVRSRKAGEGSSSDASCFRQGAKWPGQAGHKFECGSR
jgi:hypothetical protein